MTPTGQTMRRALRDLLPPEEVAQAVRDVFPREVIGEAFREGLVLFFSPFTGFWLALHVVMRRDRPRREDR